MAETKTNNTQYLLNVLLVIFQNVNAVFNSLASAPFVLSLPFSFSYLNTHTHTRKRISNNKLSAQGYFLFVSYVFHFFWRCFAATCIYAFCTCHLQCFFYIVSFPILQSRVLFSNTFQLVPILITRAYINIHRQTFFPNALVSSLYACCVFVLRRLFLVDLSSHSRPFVLITRHERTVNLILNSLIQPRVDRSLGLSGTAPGLRLKLFHFIFFKTPPSSNYIFFINTKQEHKN